MFGFRNSSVAQSAIKGFPHRSDVIRGFSQESVKRVSAFLTFALSLFTILIGVLLAMPVRQAVAEAVDYGPDGYFSALAPGAMPMRTNTSEATTRKISFGKSGKYMQNLAALGGGQVSIDGRYLMLAKGPNTNTLNRSAWTTDTSDAGWWSQTTRVEENEALIWSDDVTTSSFLFGSNNMFDTATSESRIASVSKELDSTLHYSQFELDQLGSARKLNAVCVIAGGCGGGVGSDQSESNGMYRVFPLSFGDMAEFFNANNGRIDTDNSKRGCSDLKCNNAANGYWLRSAHWTIWAHVPIMGEQGAIAYNWASLTSSKAMRPAARLNLEKLILSADAGDQSQKGVGDWRLTFVDSSKTLLTWSAGVTGGAGSRMIALSGESDLTVQSGLGWKVVDPNTNTVLGSGRSSSGGNMMLPESLMTDDTKAYVLYVWAQEDGNASVGWTNKATEPVKATITGWQVKAVVPYGIEMYGVTAGTLRAYRIGEYEDVRFDPTGALRSVRLRTPADPVRAEVLAAASAAGATTVDEENPMGWVAAHWLGYPTDPGSDDVTSAFSPYAGKLQLFAKALAADTGVLGTAAGSLPGLSGGPEVLKVSGPGLYLIVDSSGASLPMIVGTRVFNEDVGDEGRYVDFVDAGVKGKPRLGQASLKTTVTDVAKRIVNDAGLDGFDVGSEVEYEIAVRVPDLSEAGFASVSYAAYEFAVADVAEAGLTLPAASEVKVLMDVPSPDTEVTGTAGVSVGVSGQTLSVSGLKAVFAESDGGSGVRNKASVPAGSLMRVRYRAVLNAGASYSLPGGGGLDANANTATLTRSKSDGTSETKSATANAYTFEADLVKVDKDEMSKRLGGVQFEVSRDGRALKFVKLSDGVYRLDAAGGTAVATHADGTLSLLGVEARELSFKETVAPSGYFKVSDFGVDVRPVWDADATQVTKVSYATTGTNLAYVSQDGKQVVVLDPAWSLANLPYTGGIGILVLLIIGGLILAFAVRPYILSHWAERDANLI